MFPIVLVVAQFNRYLFQQVDPNTATGLVFSYAYDWLECLEEACQAQSHLLINGPGPMATIKPGQVLGDTGIKQSAYTYYFVPAC